MPDVVVCGGACADGIWGWGVGRPWVGSPGSASFCLFVAPGDPTAPGKGMNAGEKAVVERESIGQVMLWPTYLIPWGQIK